MKKRRLILLMASLAVVLGLGLWIAMGTRTPREFSWDAHLVGVRKEHYESEWTHPSVKVMRQQWTNSVPLLIRMLKEKDSFGQRFYRLAYSSAPEFVSKADAAKNG